MISFPQRELIVEDDCEWFWCHSEASTGLTSNWSAMVNAAILGGSTGYIDHTSSYALDCSARRSEIKHLLQSLPTTNQNILYYSFSNTKFKVLIEKIFKKHTGAALASNIIDPDRLFSLCNKIHLGTATAQDKLTISKIIMESKSSYIEAINSYFLAKLNKKEIMESDV